MKLLKKKKSKDKTKGNVATELAIIESHSDPIEKKKLTKKEKKRTKQLEKVKVKEEKAKKNENEIEVASPTKKKKIRVWPKKKKKGKDIKVNTVSYNQELGNNQNGNMNGGNLEVNDTLCEETPLQQQITKTSNEPHQDKNLTNQDVQQYKKKKKKKIKFLHKKKKKPLDKQETSNEQHQDENSFNQDVQQRKKKKNKKNILREKEKQPPEHATQQIPKKKTVENLQNDVIELRQICDKNISKLIEREENLTDLNNTAEQLHQDAEVFKKKSRDIKVQEESKNTCCGICSFCPCCFRCCDSIREFSRRICGKNQKPNQKQKRKKKSKEMTHQERVTFKQQQYGIKNNDDRSVTVAVFPQADDCDDNDNRQVTVDIETCAV